MPREKAGFNGPDGLRRVALRLRISASYLSRCEARHSFPYVLALRLSRLYHCPLDVFVIPTKTEVREVSVRLTKLSPTKR